MRFIRRAVIADSNLLAWLVEPHGSNALRPPRGEPSVAVLVWLTELYLYRLQRSLLRGNPLLQLLCYNWGGVGGLSLFLSVCPSLCFGITAINEVHPRCGYC